MTESEPTICGAGHRCCDVAAGPPYHDHFLSPGACPKCEHQGQADYEPDRWKETRS